MRLATNVEGLARKASVYLRAWYGAQATKENGWGFEWLPKNVGDHSQLPMTLAMRDGVVPPPVAPVWTATPYADRLAALQAQANKLDYVPLPDTLVQQIKAYWAQTMPY